MSRLLVALLVLRAGCGAPAALREAGPTYANPVLDADFPDPAVLRAPDGFYYVHATQSEHQGRTFNLQLARSSAARASSISSRWPMTTPRRAGGPA